MVQLSRPLEKRSDRARSRARHCPWSIVSLSFPGPGCVWHPGVSRRESRYPTRALRPAGACGPSCPSGCIRDLPSRACQHQATLSGPRVTRCWLHWPGPSSGTLKGCLRADPRCRSHDPKVFCVEQIGRTSEPSGARAVTRVRGPAPGLPVSLGSPPTTHPARGLSESQFGSVDSDVTAQGLARGALTRIGPMSDPSHPWSGGHLGPLPSAPVQRPRLPSGSSAFARAAGVRFLGALQDPRFPAQGRVQ